MSLKLTELRTKVQSHFKNSCIMKENLSHSFDVLETDSGASLQKVELKKLPIENCWIFENENGENELRSNGKKPEVTIIYLDKENKKLFVIMVELKSTLDVNKLIHCRDKFRETLSHLSVFLLINNHNEFYADCTLYPVGLICHQSEVISTSQSPLSNEISLVDGYKNYLSNEERSFLVELNTITLGRQYIKAIAIKNTNNASNSMSIEFIQDVIRKVI